MHNQEQWERYQKSLYKYQEKKIVKRFERQKRTKGWHVEALLFILIGANMFVYKSKFLSEECEVTLKLKMDYYTIKYAVYEDNCWA